MQSKRGLSPLVSWVLLIGFVVGLSLMVGSWVRDTAESTTEEVVKDVEIDLRCADVALNAAVRCDTPYHINITNRGKFTIAEVRIRQPGNTLDYPLDVPVREKKTQALNNFDTTLEADIIPLIKVGEKSIVCSARKVVVQCP